MEDNGIVWKIPWSKIQFEVEVPSVQNQPELEINNKHVLWYNKVKNTWSQDRY